jgi:hypothetical protein
MFTKRLFNVLVVLILGIVAFFALQVAAETGTPSQYSSRYNQTGQTAESVEVAGSIPEVRIDAEDYSFTMPETINAGWARIILTNSGAEPHHIQFMRLNDGVTANQFMEALNQDIGPALAMVKEVGGVAPIHPGGLASAVLNLPVGDYVVLCFIPSPSDQTPHLAKGMFKSLKVEAGAGVAEEPSAELTIHLKDFLFDMPDSLPAGALTVEVINDGPESHEFNIHRLEDGKTANDMLEFLNGTGGPPPFTPVGGINGLSTGLKGYAELNLEPGTYVAICNIPSPKAEGHPHFTLGMIKQFTVGSAASSNFPIGKFVQSGKTDYGLLFNTDGTFSVFEGDKTFVHATYNVEGNVFTETSNDGGCETNESFTYTFDGTNLTFNYVGNPDNDTACAGRHADFNNVTYVLSE